MTKRLYKLAEVCKLLDLQPYVLRYWETEFSTLQDGEGRGSNRGYTASEVDLLRRIKRLLYEEGYTIAGAKKKVETDSVAAVAPLFEEASAEPPAGPATNAARAPGVETATLDTAPHERIETLERGIAEALDQARALLALLEAKRR